MLGPLEAQPPCGSLAGFASQADARLEQSEAVSAESSHCDANANDQVRHPMQLTSRPATCR